MASAKFEVQLELSPNSDYSSPVIDSDLLTYAYSPSEWVLRRVVSSTTEMTLNVVSFDSISALMVRNNSETAGESIHFTFYTSVGSTTSVDTDYADADPDTITEGGTQSLTFTDDGAEVGGYVRVNGSNQNDGTYLIQAASAESLTLGTGESLTAETNDTNSTTLNWQRKIKAKIDPGNILLFTGAIARQEVFRHSSDAGTPEIDIFVLGT